MYGINLVEVAKILGVTFAGNALFNKNGVVHSIHQEIIKYSAQQNIDMVKVMMRALAQQHEGAYNDVVDILRKNFSEQELLEIFPVEK